MNARGGGFMKDGVANYDVYFMKTFQARKTERVFLSTVMYDFINVNRSKADVY